MPEQMGTLSAENIATQVRLTRRAAQKLARLSSAERDRILFSAAEKIEAREAEILAANQTDCQAFDREVAKGAASPALAKRLKTSPAGIKEMAKHVRDVARLEDPLGKVLATTELDDDLVLQKVPCPLGVVAVVFESRPDVIPQVGSLAVKTGNGLIMKGGSEALRTNRVLVSIWCDALAEQTPTLSAALSALEDRTEVMQLLQMQREIDLVVPRGSTEFVNFIFQHSRIPVLGHGSGVCHIYVDSAADLKMACNILIDAKVQYPAACNAVEKALVHQAIAARFLPDLVAAMQSAGVEVRGCRRTLQLCPGRHIVPAVEADWHTEYGDLKITVKVVSDLQEAVEHINHYGSRHTEAILTEDADAAERFMDHVDAASVFHNASTRFADGYRYGLGAELGISTSKLHARGPVGMEGLLTYKYKLRGNSQMVSDYAERKRTFKHRPR